MAVQWEPLLWTIRGVIEMEKVNLSVNVQGVICDDDVLMPTKLEDCAKLIPEEKLVKLCRSRIKQMVVSDLRQQAQRKRLLEIFDSADETAKRELFRSAVLGTDARRILFRTI
jgi:hypothetical protein